VTVSDDSIRFVFRRVAKKTECMFKKSKQQSARGEGNRAGQGFSLQGLGLTHTGND